MIHQRVPDLDRVLDRNPIAHDSANARRTTAHALQGLLLLRQLRVERLQELAGGPRVDVGLLLGLPAEFGTVAGGAAATWCRAHEFGAQDRHQTLVGRDCGTPGREGRRGTTFLGAATSGATAATGTTSLGCRAALDLLLLLLDLAEEGRACWGVLQLRQGSDGLQDGDGSEFRIRED